MSQGRPDQITRARGPIRELSSRTHGSAAEGEALHLGVVEALRHVGDLILALQQGQVRAPVGGARIRADVDGGRVLI